MSSDKKEKKTGYIKYERPTLIKIGEKVSMGISPSGDCLQTGLIAGGKGHYNNCDNNGGFAWG